MSLIASQNLISLSLGLLSLFLIAVILILRNQSHKNVKALDDLRNEMQKLNVAMLKISASGTILYVNSKAEDLLGRTRDSLLGMYFSECFIESHRMTVKDSIHNNASELTVCTNSSRLFLQVEYGNVNVQMEYRDVFLHDINELQRAYDIEYDKYRTIARTLTELNYGRIQIDLKTEHMVLDDRAKQILGSRMAKLEEMSSRHTIDALSSRIHKEDELNWNKFIKLFEQDGRANGVFRFLPLDRRLDTNDMQFELIRFSICSPSRTPRPEGYRTAEAIITKDKSLASLTDKALHAEVKLKAIVSSSSNPMYIVDRSGELLDYNASFSALLKMLGVKVDKNNLFTSTLLPENIVALHKPVTGLIGHSKQVQFVTSDVRKNEIHLRLTLMFAHMTNHLDEDNSLQVIGTLQNVTDTIKAAKELEEERTQLANIYDLAPLAIAKVNADNRIIMANHLFTHILRYTQNECLELHLNDLTINRQHASTITTDLKRTGKVRDFHTTLKAKDESLYPCELNIDLIHRENQEYLIWIFDRTAERFEQNKFETLLDNCHMPMAILGEQGFTSVNESALEFFGQKSDESLLTIMPYDLSLNYDKQKADEMKREIDHVLLSGKVNSFAWEYSVNEEKLPCHCTFIPVFKDQAFESILCMFIDHRDLLRADEERIQALALQQQAIAEQRLALKEVEETQAKLDYNKERLASYEAKLASVQEQYNKTRQEAETKQRQLQHSKDQLANTEVKLASVMESYDSTRQDAQAAHQQLLDSKGQLADTEKQLAKVKERYFETREEAQVARRQLSESRDQLDSTTQQLEIVQKQFDQTRHEAALTQQQLTASNDKLANTVEQLASVQAEFDDTRKEYTDLKESHENVAENLKALQSQYKQSRDLLAAAEQSNQDLTSQLEDADRQVKGLSDQREEVLKALQDSEANYQKTRKALVASEANVDHLKNNLKHEKARQGTLENEIAQMQHAVANKDQQISSVNAKIEELQGQLSNSKDASELLKSQLNSQRKATETAKKEQKMLAESYQSAKTELSNKERNLQHMQDELNKLETMSQQERSDMQAQQDILKRELAEKHHQLQHTAGELESAKIAAEHERRASNAQKQLVANLQNELQTAENHIAEKQAMMSEQEQKLQDAQNDLIAELKNKQQQLQQAEAVLQNTKEQSEAERASHKQVIDNLKMDLTELEGRSAEQQERIKKSDEQWQRDKEILSQEINARREQLELTKEELEAIIQQAEKERYTRIEQEGKLQQLQTELADVESRAEKQNKMLAGSEEQWSRYHEEIEQQKLQLQQSLEQANIQNQALQQQLKGKKDALNQAEKQVDASKSGEQELVNELEMARSEADGLQQRIEEQANHEKALQEQLEQQQNALQSKESTIAELQSSQEALTAELAKVQTEYAQSKQTLSEQQHSHDGLNTQMTELEQALAESQQALKEKESALSEVQKALETSQSKLEEQETELVQAHKTELEEYSRNTAETAVRIPNIEELEMPDNPSDWFDLLPYLQNKGEVDSLPMALSTLIESLQTSLEQTDDAIKNNDVTAVFKGVRSIIAVANEVNSEVLTDIMSAIEFDCKCGLFDNVSIRWPAARQSVQQTLRVVYSHLHK